MKHIPHFINNKPIFSQGDKIFESVNPATQEVWAQIAHGGKAEVDLAVEAARKAFDEGPWPKMTAKERAKILYKLADWWKRISMNWLKQILWTWANQLCNPDRRISQELWIISAFLPII